jgi:predicted ferric reductase
VVVLTRRLQAIIAIGLLSVLPYFRRFSYEIFLRTHLLFAITLAVAIWRHVHKLEAILDTLLVVTLGCFAGSLAAQISTQVYRNCTRHLALAHIDDVHIEASTSHPQLMILGLRLARPWHIQPGQYVHLRLLTSKAYSWMQRHPFAIVWWDDSLIEGKARKIYVMIETRHGWTRRIIRYQALLESLPVWLGGPYGSGVDLGQYGYVLLFASDSGIFAVLPIIKGLLEHVQKAAAAVRRVKLIWHTESIQGKQLEEWMNQLLQVDKEDSAVGRRHCVI